MSEDLKSKMVFVGGPRQVGKTTFALAFLSEPTEKHPAYLNWDDVSVKADLMKGELPGGQKRNGFCGFKRGEAIIRR